MAASEVPPLGTVEMLFSTNSRRRFGHPLHRSRAHTELVWQGDLGRCGGKAASRKG